MCMAPAHHWAGFATGAALAMHAHQPAWVAVGSACLAAVTAGATSHAAHLAEVLHRAGQLKRYQIADEDKALDADIDEGAGT